MLLPTVGFKSSSQSKASPLGVIAALWQDLFLCSHFLSKKENVHLFSSSFPRFDKCHETSRIFPRTEQTFASARSFGVISWASFSRENGPFGFGRAPSASQKALSKSKGTFLRENECAKWYQNFGNVKICGRQRGIFVIVCGICRGVDKKQISKCQNWPKKPRKCCTKLQPVLCIRRM